MRKLLVMLLLTAPCFNAWAGDDKSEKTAGVIVHCAAANMQVAQALFDKKISTHTATEKESKQYDEFTQKAGENLKMSINMVGKEKTDELLTKFRKLYEIKSEEEIESKTDLLFSDLKICSAIGM